MTKYLVLYEQGEDGAWGAYSPDLEGVFALGRTRDEVTARMHEAAQHILGEQDFSAFRTVHRQAKHPHRHLHRPRQAPLGDGGGE